MLSGGEKTACRQLLWWRRVKRAAATSRPTTGPRLREEILNALEGVPGAIVMVSTKAEAGSEWRYLPDAEDPGRPDHGDHFRWLKAIFKNIEAWGGLCRVVPWPLRIMPFYCPGTGVSGVLSRRICAPRKQAIYSTLEQKKVT